MAKLLLATALLGSAVLAKECTKPEGGFTYNGDNNMLDGYENAEFFVVALLQAY